MARYTYQCAKCLRKAERIVRISNMNQLQPCHDPNQPLQDGKLNCEGKMYRVQEVEITAHMPHQWSQR